MGSNKVKQQQLSEPLEPADVENAIRDLNKPKRFAKEVGVVSGVTDVALGIAGQVNFLFNPVKKPSASLKNALLREFEKLKTLSDTSEASPDQLRKSVEGLDSRWDQTYEDLKQSIKATSVAKETYGTIPPGTLQNLRNTWDALQQIKSQLDQIKKQCTAPAPTPAPQQLTQEEQYKVRFERQRQFFQTQSKLKAALPKLKDMLNSLSEKSSELQKLSVKLLQQTKKFNLPTGYIREWEKLNESLRLNDMSLILNSLDNLQSSTLTDDTTTAWRRLMPDTSMPPTDDGAELMLELQRIWASMLLVPYVQLLQFIFEALPHEVPAMKDAVEQERADLLGNGDLATYVGNIAQDLGMRYTHLELYKTDTDAVIYNDAVSLQGVDRDDYLHGLRPAAFRPGLVFRVPGPVLEPTDARQLLVPSLVVIFRHEEGA